MLCFRQIGPKHPVELGHGADVEMSLGERMPLTSESEQRDRVLNRRVQFSILVRRQAAGAH